MQLVWIRIARDRHWPQGSNGQSYRSAIARCLSVWPDAAALTPSAVNVVDVV